MIKEIRSVRVKIGEKNVAVFDLSATVFAAYLISRKMNWNFPLTIVGTFATGHVTHKLVGVKTQFS